MGWVHRRDLKEWYGLNVSTILAWLFQHANKTLSIQNMMGLRLNTKLRVVGKAPGFLIPWGRGLPLLLGKMQFLLDKPDGV
jgi:hypothetical protein